MPRKRRPPRPGSLTDLAPLPILRKILTLQGAWYASAAILIVFSALVAGHRPINLNLLLDWRTVRADSTVGWMMGMCWALTGLVSVIWVLLIVIRSKMVIDFVLTAYFVHLVATTLYSGSLPFTLFWWAVQALSAGVMTALGIWACRWRELRPISFGGTAATADVEQQGMTNVSSDGNDTGVGYIQGNGRGLGADGGGSYEMVDRSGQV